MILEAEGDADIQETEEGLSGPDAEFEPETAGATAAESEAGEADSGPTLASVRDQGGRAMHRMSRRMRRRMRSEKGPESPAEPPRHEREREPRVEAPRAEHRPAQRVEKERTSQTSITELLKEGQEIIVQIAKEPLGQKGARITSHIALPGRYVVYMPTLDHMGVSRKIASDDERLRLKKILQRHRVGIAGGFIVRTAGEGRTEDEIGADMTFLGNLWLDIRGKAEKRKAPALLHHDLDIVQRILRDQLNDAFKSIWVDTEEMYERILRFVQRFQPALVNRVKMYTRRPPIFDAFNITNELEKALRPKVWLKSGGYIVINQTEALVAVDINTGKFVGKSNRLEDTIVKTNTDAVKEIVRQIRLRDLGGIIVIDFIDMDERKNRQKVMQALEEAMRADRAPYKILQFNDFGLVAITRKRVKQSLERTLCSPCPYCEGAGYVKSVQTVIGEILIEAQKIAKAVEGSEVVLRVHPDVAKTLKSTSNHFLEEIEEVLKRPVLVVSDNAVHHEKFDLA
jgi:ribonuclease G